MSYLNLAITLHPLAVARNYRRVAQTFLIIQPYPPIGKMNQSPFPRRIFRAERADCRVVTLVKIDCAQGEEGLTKPIDITDPMVAKAYSHPLRIEILGLLDNRTASPRQIATELGAGLSTTSYHVRQLASLNLIRLVKRRQVRGAIEHYYTATVRPTITDAGWAQMPGIVKQAWLGGKVAQIGKEVAAAASQGGFDHEDIHISRTSVRVSPEEWKAASGILARALEEIEALGAEGTATAKSASESGERDAIAVMMLFEAAAPGSFAPHSDEAPVHDNYADIAVPGDQA